VTAALQGALADGLASEAAQCRKAMRKTARLIRRQLEADGSSATKSAH
jgi:hypothetical protein